MGVLELPSGERCVLLDEHMLGRSSRCDTLVDHPDASSRHALLYYAEGCWWVRDLGSTNGTFVANQRLATGVPEALPLGSALRLGPVELKLIDEGRPQPGALELGTGRFISGDASLVLLGDAQASSASISLQQGKTWWLEEGKRREAVHDGDVFQWAGKNYRFFTNAVGHRTVQQGAAARHLAQLQLKFLVSLDEEHVQLSVSCGGKPFELGSRSHHYTLLTLARIRAEAAARNDGPESSHGWVDTQTLLGQLGSNETKLSVEICRIRQQFSKLDLRDAADIIERRRGTGQLRIGTGQFRIQRI